jgi:hypothetical protein
MHSQQATHVVPSPPLKFRTAGFPQYGFKREVDADLHEFTKRESILYDAQVRDGQSLWPRRAC